MPIAKVYTGAVSGLEAIPITVEVNVASRGFPSFNIVGLAGKEVDESKLRIRSAFDNCNLHFPNKEKITVNLAPATIPKEGSLYDLPIAVGILIAHNQQVSADVSKKIFMGELSLDGKIKPVIGTAVIGELLNNNFKYLYIPGENKKELIHQTSSAHIKAPRTLDKLVEHLEGQKILFDAKIKDEGSFKEYDILYEDIQEQAQGKRALVIAAAGNHNLALSGPPGTGKSMLAKALQSILPNPTEHEVREIIRIRSISGSLQIDTKRPFRSPHHTISRVGMVGGGSKIKPGEITLAHNGVLFMDEINEFPRSVIESLRQPLEDRKVSISRAQGTIDFPASFILVAANNPCPCGYFNSNIKPCKCKYSEVTRYQKRISGPMWDRIDLHVTMKEFDVKKIKVGHNNSNYGKDTNKIRKAVYTARQIQQIRYKTCKHKTNAEQGNKYMLENGKLSKKAKETLDVASSKLGVSPRGYFRIIKVSRTIADLEKSDLIKSNHVLEAINYRRTEE